MVVNKKITTPKVGLQLEKTYFYIGVCLLLSCFPWRVKWCNSTNNMLLLIGALLIREQVQYKSIMLVQWE